VPRPEVRDRVRVPAWVPVVTTVLAVAGLAAAAYLTVEHYTSSTTLACPETGIVNCQKVTTSPQSTILGIPVALLGLVFFAALLPACLPVAWRSGRRWLRRGRLGATVVGVALVIYLVYTELFTLNAICLWCTAVHVITLALFAAVGAGTALVEPAD
jgi:uncharacterized membrane protein